MRSMIFVTLVLLATPSAAQEAATQADATVIMAMGTRETAPLIVTYDDCMDGNMQRGAPWEKADKSCHKLVDKQKDVTSTFIKKTSDALRPVVVNQVDPYYRGSYIPRRSFPITRNFSGPSRFEEYNGGRPVVVQQPPPPREAITTSRRTRVQR